MADLQRAPQRYYQRPDAPEVSFDPTRTSLSGYAGRVNLNRNAGVWQVNAALWGVSPGFESNDLGFQSSGNRAGGHAVLEWRKQTTDRWTRSRGALVARAFAWNFNRDVTTNLWYACGNATFLNYWFMNTCGSYAPAALDDQLTRGGAMAVNPRSRSVSGFLSTDSRKWISAQVNGGHDSNTVGGWSNNGELTVNLKPLPSLSISTGPSISGSRNLAQHIQTETDAYAVATFGERYVFGTIDQTQVTLTTRVNYVMTPRASLQVFMQPLLATGNYRNFGNWPPLARSIFTSRCDGRRDRIRFRRPDARWIPTGRPVVVIFVRRSGFQFEIVAVERRAAWEFRPGSTLYAVWTQQREDSSHPSEFRFSRDAATLVSTPSNDVFLVKLTHWLGR